MLRRLVISSGLAITVAGGVVSLEAQSTPAAQGAREPYSPARTPWGDPDLQGIWPSTDMVGVPFERPDRFGTRLFLTEEEFKEREAQAEKQAKLDEAKLKAVASTLTGSSSVQTFVVDLAQPAQLEAEIQKIAGHLSSVDAFHVTPERSIACE